MNECYNSAFAELLEILQPLLHNQELDNLCVPLIPRILSLLVSEVTAHPFLAACPRQRTQNTHEDLGLSWFMQPGSCADYL